MLGSNSSADSGPELREQVNACSRCEPVLAESDKSRRSGGRASRFKKCLPSEWFVQAARLRAGSLDVCLRRGAAKGTPSRANSAITCGP